MIDASANIVSCGVGVVNQACCDSVPAAGCLPPPCIDQVEAVTSVLHSETYSGCVLVSNAPRETIVLANPCAWRELMVSSGFCGRHGGPCACRGVASRGSFDRGPRPVVVRTIVEGMLVLVQEPHHGGEFGSWHHGCRSGVVPSAQGVAGMHIAGNGCTVPELADET
jgi:hypothetical protein